MTHDADAQNAHDQVVTTMLKVLEPERCEIRLLGRVADERLGNRSDKEVYLFVPDLHLLSAQRLPYFGNYCFNHAKTELLAKLLEALGNLRCDWRDDGGHELVTVQLGDFFDMWREFSRKPRRGDVPIGECARLRDVLYRGGRPCLDATMLLGNHDTKSGVPLEEIPFQLKAYDRDAAGQPFLFATHGDVFDLLEKLAPDRIQELVVRFFGRMTPVNSYQLYKWKQAGAATNRPLDELKRQIVRDCHRVALPKGAPIVRPGTALPSMMARKVEDPRKETTAAFHRFHQAIRAAAADDPCASRLRVVVVGHSHHPKMMFYEHDETPLLLLDAGAWIERCVYPLAEGGEVEEPNAQLAVLHGNDARIYQVRVPA